MSIRTMKEVVLPSSQTQPLRLAVVVVAWAIVVATDIVFWVNLTTSSLWLDELWTAYYTDPSLGLTELLLDRIPRGGTPPIYYIFAYLWQRLLGPGDASLRAMSVVTATSIPVVLFFGTRRFLSRDARLFLLLLSASSGPIVSHALNARSYAILMLFSVLTCLVFYNLQSRRDCRDNNLVKDYGQLVVACVVISLTHFYGFFLSAGLILTLLARRPSLRTILVAFAAGVTVVAIVGLYIAWHYPQITQVFYSEDTWGRNSSRFKPLVLVDIVAKGLARPLGYGVELVVIVLFLAGIFAFDRLRAGNPSRHVTAVPAFVSAYMGPSWPFISAVLIGAVAALVVSVTWRPLLSQRNLLAFAPAMWLIAAFFVEQLIAIHGKVGKIAVLALMTLLLAYRGVDIASLFEPSKEEWKTSAAFIAAEPACTAETVAVVGFSFHYAYYLPQRHHSRFLSLDREKLQTADIMERQGEIKKIYNLDHRCPILLWSVFWLSAADVYRLAGDIDVRRLNGFYHSVKVFEFPHVYARRLSREKVTGAFVIMAE